MSNPPKEARVFISYSHDNEEHRQRVLALAQRLREDGVEAIIDRFFDTSPPAEGWEDWMENQIEAADYVLVVCTAVYYRRFRGKETAGGRGVRREGTIISQILYDNYSQNTQFIPIGFAAREDNLKHIPRILRSTNYYNMGAYIGDADYDALHRHLTRQPDVVPRPVGSIKPQPPQATTWAIEARVAAGEDIIRASGMAYYDIWIEIEEALPLYRIQLIGPSLEPGQSDEIIYTGKDPQQLSDAVSRLNEQFKERGSLQARDAGDQLYRSICTDEWAVYLEQLRARCEHEGSGLRLHVTTENTLVASLPWEQLAHPWAQQPLSRPPRCVVLRSPPGRCAEERALGPPRMSVRLLAVTGGAGEEIDIIRRCLVIQEQRGAVSIDTSEPDSWDALRHDIRARSPHLLHLVAPGDGRGIIIGQSPAYLVSYTALQDFLITLPDLRMVVLNVLNGQPGTPASIFADPLPGLHASDKLWAVAVTRTPVNAATARWYSHMLYGALAAGHSLAFAVGLGRFGVAHCNLASIAQEWSIFMTDQICDVIPFPPLTVPPRWAAKTRPQPEQVVALLHQANEANRSLRPISIALESPTPPRLRNLRSADPYRSVLEDLGSLDCRHDLTSWHNAALDLTYKAQTALGSCIQAIEQLKRPSLDPDVRVNMLRSANNSLRRLEGLNYELIKHIELLLTRLWAEEKAG